MNKEDIKKGLACCSGECCPFDGRCAQDKYEVENNGECPYHGLTSLIIRKHSELQDDNAYPSLPLLFRDAHNLIIEQEKEIDLLKMQMKDVVNHADTFLEEANKFENEQLKENLNH